MVESLYCDVYRTHGHLPLMCEESARGAGFEPAPPQSRSCGVLPYTTPQEPFIAQLLLEHTDEQPVVRRVDERGEI
jgi:hypothetical protein